MSWRCVDPRLCQDTVTVYHREGLTRRVIENAHFELTDKLSVTQGRQSIGRDFLLVIPGGDPIAVGDKVVLGVGPEVIAWEDLNTAAVPDLGVVETVKPRYFKGLLCHTEARGN